MSFIPGATGVASTFPDGLLLGAGTVTAPSYRLSDAQTGFYRPAVNQFALSSAGVQTWLVDATGATTLGPTGFTGTHTVNSSVIRFTRPSDAVNVSQFISFTNASGTAQAYLGLGANTGAGIQTGEVNNGLLLKSDTGLAFAISSGISGSISNTGAWTLGRIVSVASPNSITHDIYTTGTSGGLQTVLNLHNRADGASGAALDFMGVLTNQVTDVKYARIASLVESSASGAYSGSLQFYTANTAVMGVVGTVTSQGGWTFGPASFASSSSTAARHTVNGRIAADNIIFVTSWASSAVGSGTILTPVNFDTQTKTFMCSMAYSTTSTNGQVVFTLSSYLGVSPFIFKVADSGALTITVSNSGGKVLLTVTGIAGNPIISTLALSIVGGYVS